ncbi:MAG: MaoC family dehydratase N-terminal domain-containing protein [Chloroflexi bacterium]|nr:MaoC family dehydratase N-terminal domain-containing protein [Chloroflexota bacterium]MDA1147665.1 MaoC family dehydratase N-terminal domain-containing protein [Chloroflexota bacterium]
MVDKFPVEAGHIMLFARSVGDTNQVYYDEDYAKTTEAGGIVAPPTFVQASAQWEDDYPLRPTIGQPWFGSGKEPTGVKRESSGGGGGGGLHAEQHYEYHRHLRPGDVLHSVNKPGEKWERESKRAGTLKFSESITEYYDQNNELVITARSVGVQTERPVDQG